MAQTFYPPEAHQHRLTERRMLLAALFLLSVLSVTAIIISVLTILWTI